MPSWARAAEGAAMPRERSPLVQESHKRSIQGPETVTLGTTAEGPAPELTGYRAGVRLKTHYTAPV
ncbi:MAG: hypothetical protein K0S35_710 [Geminicoccaceae bacterium]|jgi:hypothetical protein|nr:hypothetical protein [Geminicoccaceae bacterium]MCD6056965.1 hypothetical protein [Thermomicrobiales bacterium]